MPRVPRINIENALYYITSRGDHNEDIFKEGSDYAMYLDLLKRGKEQYKFKLFAFCLMPNHAHLLIEPAGNTTISHIMHAVNPNYTKYFNAKHRRDGHLFQERYKMVLVEKETNLLNVTSYIHLNPKALKLVSDIIEYSYSSYPLYIEEDRGSEKTGQMDIKNEIREALDYLKGASYKDFIDKMPAEEMDKLGKLLGKKAAIGSEEFMEKIKSKVESEKQKSEELAETKAREPLLVKRLVVLGGVMVVIAGLIALSLYARTVKIRKELKSQIEKGNAEITVKVNAEKQKIVKDLGEKYRADMVSYQAMSKRLEAEKKKVGELEKSLKGSSRPEDKKNEGE